MYTNIATPVHERIITDLPSGKDVKVFGAGDYFTKNGHLYFVLDYKTGGFIIENCSTLCQHPVEFEFMQLATRWIARDSSYARVLRYKRGEVKPEDND